MNRFVVNQLGSVQRMLERWMKKRATEVIFPETVECVEDIAYLPTGKDCHKMDIYRPKNANGKLPVILNLHGGGLLLCTRRVNRAFCAELAERGFLVFCVDYPLVPDADVPRILSDASAGMDRVRELIEVWNGDPEQAFIVGDSAGAFLGVYALAAQKNEKLAQALNLVPSGLHVKAAAFLSGMFYTTRMDSVGMFLRSDFYGKQWKNHPFRPYADPAVPEVAGAMPPCFLVTAKLDNLRSYTLAFCKGLRKGNVPYRLLDLPAKAELNHDFAIIRPERPEAQRVIDEICAFLRKYVA